MEDGGGEDGGVFGDEEGRGGVGGLEGVVGEGKGKGKEVLRVGEKGIRDRKEDGRVRQEFGRWRGGGGEEVDGDAEFEGSG